MAIQSSRYKGHRIGVVDVHGKKHLFIEGEHIPATATQKDRRYISPHLPYQSFDTLRELGKAIVEYRSMDQKGKKKKKTS
jgi:hypothetical protein